MKEINKMWIMRVLMMICMSGGGTTILFAALVKNLPEGEVRRLFSLSQDKGTFLYTLFKTGTKEVIEKIIKEAPCLDNRTLLNFFMGMRFREEGLQLSLDEKKAIVKSIITNNRETLGYQVTLTQPGQKPQVNLLIEAIKNKMPEDILEQIIDKQPSLINQETAGGESPWDAFVARNDQGLNARFFPKMLKKGFSLIQRIFIPKGVMPGLDIGFTMPYLHGIFFLASYTPPSNQNEEDQGKRDEVFKKRDAALLKDVQSIFANAHPDKIKEALLFVDEKGKTPLHYLFPEKKDLLGYVVDFIKSSKDDTFKAKFKKEVMDTPGGEYLAGVLDMSVKDKPVRNNDSLVKDNNKLVSNNNKPISDDDKPVSGNKASYSQMVPFVSLSALAATVLCYAIYKMRLSKNKKEVEDNQQEAALWGKLSSL